VRVLRCLFGDVMRSEVRKERGEPLVRSVWEVAGQVVRYERRVCGEEADGSFEEEGGNGDGEEDESHDAEIMSRYVEDIIRHLTRGGKNAAIAKALLHPDRNIMASGATEITGAAAVGSLKAVKYLLAMNLAGWPSQQYRIWHELEEGLYSDPIRAAASNGHVEVLQYLLTTLETLMSKRSMLNLDPYLTVKFQRSLTAAIQSRHSPTITTLAKFIHRYRIHEANSLYSPDLSCTEEWIKAAAQTCCTHTYETTLTCIEIMQPTRISPSVSTWSPRQRLSKALLFACQHGQVNLLRHILALDCAVLHGYGPSMDLASYPVYEVLGTMCMRVAAQYMHRGVADVLLENDVCMNTGRPIKTAIRYKNVAMVRFMVERGARVDEEAYAYCAGELEKRGYKGLRDYEKSSMAPVVFYLVARCVGEVPRVGGDGVDWMERLVQDVEDSKVWSWRVEAMLGLEVGG
jgi:hypothetical protein